MSEPRPDPCDLPALRRLARDWSAEPGRLPELALRQIIIETDARDAAVAATRELRLPGAIALVVDSTPIWRAGADLKAEIEELLRGVAPVRRMELPSPHHADLESARRLAARLDGAGLIVALGSGSVCDTAKYARELHAPRLPFLCLPTAASVTAYTSSLAVLLVDGVKRTLPASLPEAVVADLTVLAEAPAELTRAGFGDVLARSVAYGDWYLASQLGLTEGFDGLATRLIEPSETAMIAAAVEVGRGEPAAVRLVFEALLLAGLAMTLVGQTSPLSGWEHVISHLLDMTAAAEHRDFALHGEQVGVATLLTARAFERFWPRFDAAMLGEDLATMRPEHVRAQLDAVFAPFDRTGAMRVELWRDLEVKLARWAANRCPRASLAARRAEVDTFLARAMRPATAIERALKLAGAPTTFDAMSVPAPPEAARFAVRWAHLVRRRFTLGDLFAATGWLDDARVGELLAELG